VEYSDQGAWEDHTTPQFYGYDPAQANPQSVAMGSANLSDVPYTDPTLYAQAINSGATAGPSSNPPNAGTIDFTGDAADAWDPVKKVANSQALTFYKGSNIYGFVDGHAEMVPFVNTFSWPSYNPASWTQPAVNWYDPKVSK
jgi:hypothetical protein